MRIKNSGLRVAVLFFAVPVFMANASCGGDDEVSDAPTDLTAEPVPGPAIHITWQDTVENETNYLLERKDTGAYKVIVTLPFNSNNHHDDDPTLVPGTTYAYRLRAKYSDGTYTAYSKTATSVPGGG